jgi:SAM-dependent methyltransferase
MENGRRSSSEENGWRRLLKRGLLKGTAFSNSHQRIRMLYAIADPWNLGSPKEQYRFSQTNRQILEFTGVGDSVLEIGCGEGHQSLYLSRITPKLYGIDVSAKAIKRARERCPGAMFRVGSVDDVLKIFPKARFDLIVACEVLYYVKDIEGAVRQLQQITDSLYVSNFSERASHVSAYLAGEGWLQLPSITYEDTEWKCMLWRRCQTG